MSTGLPAVDHPAPTAQLPPCAQVEALARELLAGEATRLQHVRTAGLVATRLTILFDPEDAELLILAANLHDIGYSARVAHTGFHPLTAVPSCRRRDTRSGWPGSSPTTPWPS